MAVWAAPFVYNGGCEGGGEGRIEVVTPSYAYQILANLDQIAQKPELNVTALDQPFVKTGTVVTVDWKRQVSSYLDDDEDESEKPNFYKEALDLLQTYSFFNPHAGFTLCGKGRTVEIAKPLIEGWQKWLPSDPTPPMNWHGPKNASAYQVLDGDGNPLPGVLIPKTSQEDIDRSAAAYFAQVKDAAIASAKEALDQLTNEERLDIFTEYCRACGSKDPKCQCWNDE